MLKKLRSYHIKKIFWFLIIVVVPSFIFWGISFSLQSRKQNIAITVAGKPMSRTEFEKYLTMARIYYQITMGNDFYTKINHQLLESKAFQFILLLHKAKEDKIKTGDKEVVKVIENIFSINGKFDDRQYKGYVSEQLMLTPRVFEEYLRKILTADKVTTKYVRNVKVKEDEIRKAYKMYNEKIKLSYIFIPYKQSSDKIKIDEASIKNYYAVHKKEFSKEPKIKIKYFILNKNKDRKIINDISRHIRSTKSINYIVNKFSLTPHTTDYFDEEHLPRNLKWSKKIYELAFSMPLNKLSPLIEGNNYILFEKIGQKKEAARAIEQVKDEIIQKLKIKAEKEEAEKETIKIIKEAVSDKSKSFSDIAKEYNLKNTVTKYLTRNEVSSALKIDYKFIPTIFSLKKDEVYNKAITNNKGLYVVKLKDLLLIDEAKFKKEKEFYRQKLLAQKIFIREINFFSKLEKEIPLRKIR